MLEKVFIKTKNPIGLPQGFLAKSDFDAFLQGINTLEDSLKYIIDVILKMSRVKFIFNRKGYIIIKGYKVGLLKLVSL